MKTLIRKLTGKITILKLRIRRVKYIGTPIYDNGTDKQGIKIVISKKGKHE